MCRWPWRSLTYGRAPNAIDISQGSLTYPSYTDTGPPFLYGGSDTPPHLVVFYDTLGIRRTYSRLNTPPPGVLTGEKCMNFISCYTFYTIRDLIFPILNVCFLIQQYEVSLSRMLNDILILDQQWLPNQSDFPPISWPWYRAWPSTIMSGFHGAFATGVACQQGTLTLPDTWFRPPFWDLLMLQLLIPNSSNLPCLYSTFHLEYPLVLSRFCFLLTFFHIVILR